MGKAYALSHDYEKAIKFYENNIEKLVRPDLILDLAKLCLQLKKFERGEELLTNDIFNEEDVTHERLKQNSDAHFQLYKLYLKKQGKYDVNPNEKAKKEIKMAVKFQKLVYEKIKSEGGSVDDEKLAYADLYYEVGKYTYYYEKNI